MPREFQQGSMRMIQKYHVRLVFTNEVMEIKGIDYGNVFQDTMSL